MMAALASSRRVFRMRSSRFCALDQGHDRDAGLESREAQGKTGKQQARETDHGEQAAVMRKQGTLPVDNEPGMQKHMKDADEANDRVQREIDANQNNCDVDCFFEALEEDGAEDSEQEEGDTHLVLQGRWSVGIVDKMGSRVRGGKSHCDDEIGGGEAQQDEHNYLAGPPRKQLLEHRYAALPVGAGGGDPIVDRQGRKERHQNQNQSRKR